MQSKRAVPIIVALAATAGLAQWSEPVNITRLPPGRLAYLPSITADSAGNLHASWSLRVAYDFDWIDYATKPAGSDTWLAPVHVSRDSWPYRGSSVVIGPGGVPHVLWQAEGQVGHLYVSHKSGDTWSTPERCPGWNGWGFGLRACADRQRRIHAVWGDLDLHTIWYARYDDSGWHCPEAAVTATGEVARPDVAADRAGYAHVVYQPPGTPVACGYVRQTDGGWLSPELIPALSGYAGRPRIALDTGDYPQVVWDEGRTVYSGWTGNGWSQPVRLDSSDGARPSICADLFGQVHVFFYDESHGVVEATCRRGAYLSRQSVDTASGWAEVAAGSAELYALRTKAYPFYHDVWHTKRVLVPPGVLAESGQASPAVFAVSATASGQLRLDMPGPSSVELEMWDVAGRRLYRRTLEMLASGHHTFSLSGDSDRSRVQLWVVRTRFGRASVKLVRM